MDRLKSAKGRAARCRLFANLKIVVLAFGTLHLDMLRDHFIGDIAARHHKVSPSPQVPTPDSLCNIRKSRISRFDVFPWIACMVFPADETESGEPARPQINVVLNWFEELKERAPAP